MTAPDCKFAKDVVVLQQLDWDTPPERCRDCIYRLTDRERQVLRLVAEGLSTNEIAEVLFVNKKTIEAHRQHLAVKLGMKSVAQQTKYAIKKGLITLE